MAMELPLQQHPTFGAALGMLGTCVKRIEIEGAAPTQLIRRFGVNFAPRGPIWINENAQTLRQSSLRIINAERASDVYKKAGFRRIMTAAHVAELDLRCSDLPAQMKGKWRNAWRKSQDCKLKLQQTTFDAARHDWLLKADLDQQRKKRFRALPHSIIHAFAAISPRDVIVLTAKQKNDVVAAMLFLRHGNVATYHLGWTNDAGRKTNAHYALLMHATDRLCDANLTRLDLGTVDTDNAPGLARFKIGSGANIRPLGGTWARLPGL